MPEKIFDLLQAVDAVLRIKSRCVYINLTFNSAVKTLNCGFIGVIHTFNRLFNKIYFRGGCKIYSQELITVCIEEKNIFFLL